MKLLIVDDEEDVRAGIRSLIDWQENGIEVIGEAEDGRQALLAVRSLQPDILLMDIRMPVMNGLQVAEALREEGHEAKSILLSGYDDFSFAQQALKFGVSEYLLKPCLPDDILATVLKLKTEILKERERRDLYASIQAKFDEQLPYLRERFLRRCLRGELSQADRAADGFRDYKIAIPNGRAIAAIVRIDEYGGFAGTAADRDVTYLRLAVRSVADTFVGSRLPAETVDDGEDIALVARCTSESDEAQLLEGLSLLQRELQKRFGFTVSVGVGEAREPFEKINESYTEAAQALEARFALGIGCLIRYDELVEASPSSRYPLTEEKLIVHAVKTGSFADLNDRVEAFFLALTHAHREHAKRCCTALLLSLYHLILETRTNPEDLFPGGLASIDSLLDVPTLLLMKDNVARTADGVARKINARKSGHKTVEQAVDYIRAHYDGELSLETVASRVYVNPNYFCLLFKQTMGVGFIDFVHQVRIDKACEYLQDKPYRTYEIAAKVGYANEKYFVQIFKKLTGCTPAQYRDRFV